jgi:hypothetical protein
MNLGADSHFEASDGLTTASTSLGADARAVRDALGREVLHVLAELDRVAAIDYAAGPSDRSAMAPSRVATMLAGQSVISLAACATTNLYAVSAETVAIGICAGSVRVAGRRAPAV